MDTPASTPAPASAAPATDDGRAALQQLDAMIARSRVEGAPVVRASAGELKLLLLITTGLMLPLAIGYVALPVENRRLVATYIAVIGFVLAGWGLWRSWLARRKKSLAGVAILYLMMFLMNFAIYTTTLLSLTHAWDLLAEKPDVTRSK